MKNKNLVLPGMIGSILEWYDFAIYAYLAPIIGSLFFPAHQKITSSLATWGVFAIGFLMRPLGGLLWGHFGDRLGRKAVLVITTSILSFATAAIGFLPTYHTIGLLAPVLLIICRLIQGLAFGGEPGFAVYLVEHAHANRRGFYGSLPCFAANFGFLIASAVTAVLGEVSWRIPFILGMALGIIGLYFRLRMPETPVFADIKTFNKIVASPTLHLFKMQWRTLLIGMGLCFMPVLTFYLIAIYIPSYLHLYHGIPLEKALSVNTVAMIVTSLATLVFGYYSDKVGRKALFYFAGVSYLFFSYPIFLLILTGSYLNLILGLSLFAIMNAACFSMMNVILIEMFAANIRYTGLAFTGNLTVALFGGTAPLIATYLIQTTQNPMVPCYLVMFAGLMTLIFITQVKETAHQALI